MIAHTEFGKTTFERENWKEWFKFPVHRNLLNKKEPIPLPKFYIKTHIIESQAVAWFLVLPLAPFVWLFNKMWYVWCRLAVFCYRRNWIVVERGEAIRWNWPVKLFYGKNKKR